MVFAALGTRKKIATRKTRASAIVNDHGLQASALWSRWCTEASQEASIAARPWSLSGLKKKIQEMSL
jgi:hypothetical protein